MWAVISMPQYGYEIVTARQDLTGEGCQKTARKTSPENQAKMNFWDTENRDFRGLRFVALVQLRNAA